MRVPVRNREIKPKNLVLVGAGHSHILILEKLAQFALEKSNVMIHLISNSEYAYYSGMIPGMIHKFYRESELRFNVKQVVSNIKEKYNFEINLKIASAKKIIAQSNTVILDNGESLKYDCLSVNIGSRTRDSQKITFNVKNCISTRPISQLECKLNQKEQELLAQQVQPNIIVCGGGLAGIEMALTLNQRWKKTFPGIQLTLIDSNEHFLSSSSQITKSKIQKAIKNEHIVIIQNSHVTEMGEDYVMIEDKTSKKVLRLVGNTFIWSTGAESHDLFKDSELETDDLGFMLVNDSLQSVQYTNIFGSGDCVTMKSFYDLGQRFPPKAGVYAVRMAPFLCSNLKNCILQQKNEYEIYEPQSDFLTIINVGDGQAIATKFGWSSYSMASFEWKNDLDLQFMQKFNQEIPVTSKMRQKACTVYYLLALIKLISLISINLILPSKFLKNIFTMLFLFFNCYTNTCVYVFYSSRLLQGILTNQNRFTTTSKKYDFLHILKTYLYKPYYLLKLGLLITIYQLTPINYNYIFYTFVTLDGLLSFSEIPWANKISVFIQMTLSTII